MDMNIYMTFLNFLSLILFCLKFYSVLPIPFLSMYIIYGYIVWFDLHDYVFLSNCQVFSYENTVNIIRCSFILFNEYLRESYPGYRHSDTFGSYTLSVVVSTTPTTAKLSYNIAMYWYCYWLVYCLIVCSEDLPETGDPILDEYMRLYNSILSFKDGLAKILLDKGVFTRFLNLSITRSKVWIK